MEKFGHQCAYCDGASGDPVLNVEHVVPKNPKHGPKGTDRISNLVIACRTCNESKDNLQPEEWLSQLQESSRKIDRIRAQRFPEAMKQLKVSLKDAAAVNATRRALFHRLRALDLPLETGTGGQTKYNRTRLGLPKTHWLDAACVGASTPVRLTVEKRPAFRIKATGHGKRQRCGTDKYGFPIRHARRQKKFMGFQTGDMVRAVVLKGKRQGTHVGRVLARATGYFRIGKADGIPYRYCHILHHADGYQYAY
nr:HNH endonuclease [Sulfobacillus thermosulfidooxidans]